MAKSIYVGNLPWSATEEQVQSLFADYGPVVSVKLVSDRETGRARGFGFVEMEEPGASAAIEALDKQGIVLIRRQFTIVDFRPAKQFQRRAAGEEK